MNTVSEKWTWLIRKECHDRVNGTNDCVAINVGNGESLEKVKMRSCLAGSNQMFFGKLKLRKLPPYRIQFTL